MKSSSGQEGAYPDFIIGGAMKSATSSLHTVLDAHDRIFIPQSEIHFFSIDDPIQHPNFFFGKKDRRFNQDYEQDFERNVAWYREFFATARDSQVIGEDSTVYLASPRAPERIRELIPGVKLIFMLRNPVDRTHSHYWHRVRKGRAVYDFEQELRYGPCTLHLRSFYKPQLERYFDAFPREQIKVIMFERFVRHPREVIEEVCSFLGVSSDIDVEAVNQHRNPSRVPKWLRLQLWLNRANRMLIDYNEDHLPGISPSSLSTGGRVWRGLLSRLQRWNLQQGSYSPMKQETRAHLAKIYSQKNRGLSDLLDREVGEYWPCMR